MESLWVRPPLFVLSLFLRNCSEIRVSTKTLHIISVVLFRCIVGAYYYLIKISLKNIAVNLLFFFFFKSKVQENDKMQLEKGVLKCSRRMFVIINELNISLNYNRNLLNIHSSLV